MRLNFLVIFVQGSEKCVELQLLTARFLGVPSGTAVHSGRNGLLTSGLPYSMVDIDLSHHTLARGVINDVAAVVLTLLFFFQSG